MANAIFAIFRDSVSLMGLKQIGPKSCCIMVIALGDESTCFAVDLSGSL